jgi:hypothetical protein
LDAKDGEESEEGVAGEGGQAREEEESLMDLISAAGGGSLLETSSASGREDDPVKVQPKKEAVKMIEVRDKKDGSIKVVRKINKKLGLPEED